MAKTLSESAAEILKASMSAGKEPMQKMSGEVQDLGGQTPTTPPGDIGHPAAAAVKEAPKPGSMANPGEKQMPKLAGAEAKKVGDEEEALKKNPVDAGSVKAEETEVEGEIVAEGEGKGTEDKPLLKPGQKLGAMPMKYKQAAHEEVEASE